MRTEDAHRVVLVAAMPIAQFTLGDLDGAGAPIPPRGRADCGSPGRGDRAAARDDH